MFNGRLSNTQVADTPLARLTLGVTGPDGARAELKFVRDPETTELVAQDVPEIPAPTPDDLEAQYLLQCEWAMSRVEGLGDLWADPIGGGDYTFENARAIQAARDAREMWSDTPLGELYDGE